MHGNIVSRQENALVEDLVSDRNTHRSTTYLDDLDECPNHECNHILLNGREEQDRAASCSAQSGLGFVLLYSLALW